MITVVIPTTARPKMLETALRSVASQTALSQIKEVLVSENAGSRASEAICRKFAQLPIRYVFRDPPLKALAHAKAYAQAASAAFTAILHDDDWWSPQHLANGLRAFEKNPDAAVYFSSFFDVTGESAPLKCDSNLMMWFGGGFPAMMQPWALTRAEALLACIPGTPGRYSTLIARTEALRASTYVYDLDNPFDNDRLLIVALLEHGSLVFQPLPEVFIRTHPSQDFRTFSLSDIHAHMERTTEWLFKKSAALGVSLDSEFAQRVARCPSEHRTAVMEMLSYPWCADPLNRRGLLPASQAEKKLESSSVKHLLRELTPPLLPKLVRKLRRDA
ncbi:glycosyltransferase family A protein [Oleiharenicola lentus]|uniref:glycosyltransferase family A protein n=1 Tax=Oleiharenicola lentus TaxID=2508720 RepID=UPI003F674177